MAKLTRNYLAPLVLLVMLALTSCAPHRTAVLELFLSPT
jgi:hypothetical protein